MYYLGVDTGGTFTDFVLFCRTTGTIHTFKTLSTPSDPGAAVEAGINRLKKEFGVAGGDIERFTFGTTVATNAVLEGKGAPTALIATKGTRDVLEIQRQWRQRLFDLHLQKPTPLAPRQHRFEVEERVTAQGKVLIGLSDDEIKRVVDCIADSPVEAVAVSLLFSFLHPHHERQIAEEIRRRLPQLHVTISSDVCPEFREYERTATTVMNAYTMPKICALADRLERTLSAVGFRGVFSIVQSNGGVMTLEKARSLPVTTLLSGPAAGVVAAARIGSLANAERVLAFDVGGTSTDIALIEDSAVRLTSEGGIGGYPVKVPQVGIHTIGAGGGSIARPQLGLLKVGPDSAGAWPGPAAYGRGGTEPTSTDAAVVLGYIDPEFFAGGELSLDKDAARRAVWDKVAQPLGMPLEVAAHAILEVQVATIVAGIRKVSVEAGKDPRDFVLMPFGGAGGIYAGAVAEELAISRILLPPYAGVLSALGMLLTDVRHDRACTRIAPLLDVSADEVEEQFRQLRSLADADMAHDRIAPDRVSYQSSCDMRYRGQAYEINVLLPSNDGHPVFDRHALRAQFDQQHKVLYGQYSPDEPVELVSYRLGAIGRVDTIELPTIEPGDGKLPAPRNSRPVYFPEPYGWTECPIFSRSEIVPGIVLTGPAIIEDRGASLCVRPGHDATMDAFGSLIIDTGARTAAVRRQCG